MSVSNLSYANANDLFMDTLSCNSVDSVAAAGTLGLGDVKAARINIGKAGTEIFINDVAFNPLVGDGYEVIAPIVAVNQNAIVVNNTLAQISMQIADATHNGIVTIADQSLAGIKTFPDGIKISATAPSVAAVNKVMAGFAFSNFTGTVSYSGGLVASGLNCVVSVLPGSTVMIAVPPAAQAGAPGGIVNLLFPVSANVANPGALPTEYLSGTQRSGMIMVSNNATFTIGAFFVSATGFVTIGKSISSVGALVAFDAGDTSILDQMIMYF